MLKQLLFCKKQNKNLLVKHTILTDVFVPIQDVISPQKTTLTVLKTDKIELSDIIIIKDNNSGEIEYIGYIDTITTKTNTEISCYPLINVFDNDYVLDQMYTSSTNVDGSNVDIDVDVVDWLTRQLTRAFIDTDDDLQALPLIIRNKTNGLILYKKIIDTANLFEVYTDLFINTGVYITFSELSYEQNKINGIYCDIHCNRYETIYKLRFDNPQIQSVDIVNNTFTNYNKVIETQELPENATAEQIANRKRYYFYLLDNNEVTREPDDRVREEEERRILEEENKIVYLGRRIKQVRSKELTFTLNTSKSDEENAKSLMQSVYNELQAPEYNLQITITMLKNDNIRLYRSVDFVAESGIMYSTNITKIEILNDKQITVTLGALRNSLTDFKKKVEVI